MSAFHLGAVPWQVLEPATLPPHAPWPGDPCLCDVVVADHGRPLGALRPVAAGPVLAGWKRAAVRRGAGEDVVPVGRVAAAVDHLALLIERRLLGEMVVAMQLVDILGDDDALGVLPWAAPDAIARVDGLGAAHGLRAEVGAPGAVP